MRKRDVCSIEDARSGDARSVTVTVYRNLSDSQLVDEIKQCVGNIGLSRAQMNREMRMRLLPALRELHERTYRRKPGFYETLEKIGLKPATVRQWFHRSNTANEVIDVLEEARPKKMPGKRESDTTQELLDAHAWNLAVAVKRKQFIYAGKLATQYLEARRESRPLSGGAVDQLRRVEAKHTKYVSSMSDSSTVFPHSMDLIPRKPPPRCFTERRQPPCRSWACQS